MRVQLLIDLSQKTDMAGFLDSKNQASGRNEMGRGKEFAARASPSPRHVTFPCRAVTEV
jgi:hypothetical protein